MCLVSKTNIPSVSDKDIEVYKLLYYTTRKRVYYNKYKYHCVFAIRTPIMDVEISELPGELVAKGPKSITRDSNFFLVEGGFIHAYTTLSSAAEHFIKNHVIATGIIPAGTNYLVGNNGDICAEKIRIENLILTGRAFELVERFKDTFPYIPLYTYDLSTVPLKRI